MSKTKPYESKFKIKYDWFNNTLELYNSKPQNSAVIAARLRKVEGHFDLLTDAYESILNICTDTADEGTVKEYELKFQEATKTFNKLEAIAAVYPDLAGTHVPTESVPQARLPPITLPTFNGDVYSWSSFISLFNSLVLSRKDISKTEKFHYLFSHVEEEPRLLIKHLPMIDDSLDTALEVLKARFENKRLITDSHISRILHLPVLINALELRTKILNPLLESTRALHNLGLPTDQWSYILLYIGLSKLPLDIKTRFEQQYGGNNMNLPTFNQLIEFLQNECRCIDTAASASEPVMYAERVRRTDRRNVHLTHNDNIIEHANYNKPCRYCQIVGHTICDCFKFGKLLRQDRKGWIQVNSLCYKCFGNHSAASCRVYVPCARCGNTGHNELICTFIARSTSPSDNRQQTRHAHVSARNDVTGGNGRQPPCEYLRSGYYEQRQLRALSPQGERFYYRRQHNDNDFKAEYDGNQNDRNGAPGKYYGHEMQSSPPAETAGPPPAPLVRRQTDLSA